MICLYSYIGSAESKVINLITHIHNYYDEPRLIKHCENDKETILVAINDFIVQGVCVCVCLVIIHYILTLFYCINSVCDTVTTYLIK